MQGLPGRDDLREMAAISFQPGKEPPVPPPPGAFANPVEDQAYDVVVSFVEKSVTPRNLDPLPLPGGLRRNTGGYSQGVRGICPGVASAESRCFVPPVSDPQNAASAEHQRND